MAVGMRALLDTVMQALPQVTHCHIKPHLLWPELISYCRGMLIILSLLSLENHISLPKHNLRYSPHIEVIFPLKQFKFWIKECSTKQVWNKKINECSFCVCVFFSPRFFFSFQVGNLGLLFMLLFFIFAALGVELFGDLGESSRACGRGGWGVWMGGLTAVLGPTECDDTHPCEGLGRHATFRNFGMAFLTLFRVSTGDNWNGIMKVRHPRKLNIAYNCFIRSWPLCSRLVLMPNEDTPAMSWSVCPCTGQSL